MSGAPAPEVRVRFALVDVFAEHPLSGNPLAVVADAPALDAAAMGRIAREFNQSETTFLLPPTRADADWRLRSFTAAGVEVFGAGHNALGAWWWLAESGRVAVAGTRTHFRQEIGDDVLAVEVHAAGGVPTTIAMRQTAPRFGAGVEDRGELAAALGLARDDIGVPGLSPQVVSTGAPHLLVPVRGRAAVARAHPDATRLAAALRACGGEGCYVFAPADPDDARAAGVHAHARFFNPTVGIVEDPATGTAAGPLACYLVAHGAAVPGPVHIAQGEDMGRPSRLEIQVRGDEVRLVGRAVTVAEGSLRVQ